MKSASDIVLKLLGLLLLTGAALKGWQLLTELMPNSNIWTNRVFLILTVEFEIALAIWLLSGIFKKFAWLATLACFSIFSVITLYKGISGVESCGCFGSVNVNPWITLFAIDIPSISALAIFRPKHKSETQVELNNASCRCENHTCSSQECKFQNTEYLMSLVHIGKSLYKKYSTPLPSLYRLIPTACFGFIILITTTFVLAFNKPAKSTFEYEVLEPEAWVDKELPIIDEIDIGKKIKKGDWLVLFYKKECPKCTLVVEEFKSLSQEFKFSDKIIRFAMVMLSQSNEPRMQNSNLIQGCLSDKKDWILPTPTTVLMQNSFVKYFWTESQQFEYNNIFLLRKVYEKL